MVLVGVYKSDIIYVRDKSEGGILVILTVKVAAIGVPEIRNIPPNE